jgi:hypothetical protein
MERIELPIPTWQLYVGGRDLELMCPAVPGVPGNRYDQASIHMREYDCEMHGHAPRFGMDLVIRVL